ncbi:MAG: hypothetical protein ACXVBE_05395 [Bdellovibrionota bacterium]
MLYLLTLLLSTSAPAASDSVAVFHRPEKVAILVNERGRNGRIQQFMNAWGVQDEIFWQSADESFRINCGRTETGATCNFRLLPSAQVEIKQKESTGHAQWKGTGPTPADVHFTFESSRENFFEFTSKGGELTIYTRKR